MKAFCGRELELIEDGKSRMVHVVKENPQVKLILEKKGKDGARLWLPDKWKLAEGNRHIYLFGEDTVYICDEYYSRALRIFYRNLLQVAYPGSGYMDINNSDFPSFIMCFRRFRKILIWNVATCRWRNLFRQCFR